MTAARSRRTFRLALRTSFWQRTLVRAGLLAIVGVLTLGSATPGLAGHSPAAVNAAPAGNAAETPSTPTAAESRPQEGEEATEDDSQYSERDTSTDSTWIVIAVALMIGLTVLGFGLAARGLSAE